MTTHPAGGGRRLALNAAAGGAANLVKIGVQLVMLPLMAHLLGPSEFGLYALALPTVAFCMILADGGLTASLAREPVESRLVWSTGFWVTLVVGAALALLIAGLGQALAMVTHQPRVSGLMNILALAPFMISLAALPSARLTREARLTVFAAADLSATLVGACLAVALALAGFGATSLALQYVAYYALRAVLLNRVAFVQPQLQFRLSSLAGHLSMGSALLSMRLSDFFGRMVENVLYGRAFGAAGLGVYTFANQTPRFVCEAASGPVWAALYAFALREPPERLAAMHVKLARLLSSLVFPVAGLMAASAPEILAFVLGPKWSDAGELLRLLIPFYALNVVGGQSGAVLFARGRGWLNFWQSAMLSTLRVVAVALGPLIGQTGVALAIDAALLLYTCTMLSTTGHPHGARRLAGAIAGPAVAAVGAGAACFALLHALGSGLGAVCAGWLGGAVVYLAVLALLQRRLLLADLEAAKSIFSGMRRRFPVGRPA